MLQRNAASEATLVLANVVVMILPFIFALASDGEADRRKLLAVLLSSKRS